MRAIFGLVGLLVTAGIVMVLMRQCAEGIAPVARKAQQQAETIAGLGSDGRPAIESVRLEMGPSDSVVVANVTPGGAMEKAYGLQRNDRIVQAGDMAFRNTQTDLAMAKALVLDAFQKQRELKVIRGTSPDPITLPFKR